MPSKSKAQANLMRAALHDPEVRRKHGISKETAREFVEADRRKKRRPKRKGSSLLKD
jgi:hypothetical protein